ncbi:MAG: hypothetical protein HY023_08200 [Chloroflexi bacterium]|nr:hypothetical protein [Chloroflexota bacterium]
MNQLQPWLVVAVAVVMGWFGGGVIWNIRRGNAVLKWIQAGLPAVGEKTTLRWLGSSAVELGIAKARAPFRRFELVLVMEPRDVPWLWLWSLARGRRDMLILRGQLAGAPRLEYEVIAPQSWTGREALGRARMAQWGDEPLGDLRFVAPKASLPVSRGNAPALLDSARNVHPTVWRLAVRREFPQLELHIPLPHPKTGDARQFFEAVRALAQQAAG